MALARCVRVVVARIGTVRSNWLTGEEGSNRVRFSKGFKAQAVRRMLEGKSATALAKEMEVSQSTLSRWLREAMKDVELRTEEPVKPRAWTPEEKLRLVTQFDALPEEERGALLRREGVHAVTVAEWRRAATAGLATNKAKGERPSKRIKELERELARKEKALAEFTALLVLKKKAYAIWGDGDEDTDERSGR